MKKCQNCGYENSAEMNFCGECGANFKKMPQMVVPLDTIQSISPNEQITESFTAERETETVVADRFQPSIPTFSAQKPQGGKKLFFIIGGFFALIFLIFAGAATMLFFYFQSKKQIVDARPTPAPTRSSKKETPILKPSATPEISPGETPEKTPETIFAPPESPTENGTFTIAADAKDWQLSEIDTVPSETFSTNVRGTIILDEIKENISAGGVNSNRERRIYKQYATGALLMRTRFADGKTSNIQPTTASNIWENYPNERGRLEFLINDNSPENNKGRFIVTVKMINLPE